MSKRKPAKAKESEDVVAPVGSVNMDALREEVIKSSGFTRAAWVKLEEDSSTILRILPPTHGLILPWHKHLFHPRGEFPVSNWRYTQEGQKPREIKLTCLQEQFNKPCPVCEFIAYAEEENDDIANKLSVRASFNMNVLNRAANQIQLWGTTPPAAKQIQELMLKPKPRDITNPEKGWDIQVFRSSNPTRYTVSLGDQGPLDFPGWEKHASDLTKVMTVLEYEEMVRIMNSHLGTEYDLEDILGVKVEKAQKKGRSKK